MPHAGRSQTPRRSFSLLELLLVLALIAGLAVASLAGYSRIAQAGAITTGAALVSDALVEARQDAVTQNTAVEVRLYDVPDANGAPAAYRAVQLHWVKAGGTTPAIHAALFLPVSVVIDSGTTYSPLLAGTPTATADPTDPHLNGQTRAFHFLPDGSTDLAAAQSWFLTLRAVNQTDPALFAHNCACVSIDPTTGRVQIFRP